MGGCGEEQGAEGGWGLGWTGWGLQSGGLGVLVLLQVWYRSMVPVGAGTIFKTNLIYGGSAAIESKPEDSAWIGLATEVVSSSR